MKGERELGYEMDAGDRFQSLERCPDRPLEESMATRQLAVPEVDLVAALRREHHSAAAQHAHDLGDRRAADSRPQQRRPVLVAVDAPGEAPGEGEGEGTGP